MTALRLSRGDRPSPGLMPTIGDVGEHRQEAPPMTGEGMAATMAAALGSRPG